MLRCIRTVTNYGRGFRRIYLLLSVAWVLWMLYQPFYEREQDVENAIASAYLVQRVCLDGAKSVVPLAAGLEAIGKCFDRFRKNEEKFLARAAPPGVNPYQQYVLADKPLQGITTLAVSCLVPPVVVYGLLWRIARIGTWVYRGFRR